MMAKHILLTGGAGYIGSHTAIALMNAGYEVSIFDNYYSTHPDVIGRVEKIVNKKFKSVTIGDITVKDDIEKAFANGKVDGVVHFAGLKAVGESVQIPEKYYKTNLIGTINLMEVMRLNGCNRLIFSSSATVYKPTEASKITEDMPLGCSNPYGWSKLFAEQAIQDFSNANRENGFGGVLLRYFNPIGNHESGSIGESPKGIPNNLLPYIQQVAIGKRPHLNVFGNDYNTRDGTGVRDYIHVLDLADGHLKAVDHMLKPGFHGVDIVNLGTGEGYSVMEMLEAFEKTCGKKLPYKVTERRPGDLATVVADPSKAEKVLGWKAQYSLDHAMQTAWKWQSENPNGYWGEDTD